MKTRIRVPNEYEDLAVQYGAKYDGRMKSFYVPEDKVISIFNPFIPLTVELVPASNWEHNVRSEMKEDWDTLRRAVYRRAGYKCEICGGVGEQHPVESHEIWSYNSKTQVQRLEGLQALCVKCHKTKHWGYALTHGMEEIVREHIKKVNGWKDEDVLKYIAEAFQLFEMRSKMEWELDLSVLTRKD
ncbi:HNH endonuclease signature motif containing protein (plasmid) [Aneurinibacillus sp. Ricciae_BoGa-3]|uniref:HNH endonuclease n=1 Tax=Aneurinibacillus sp. Ricciae_BoGa-3 TaxID=3022697 RepID=UPI002341F97A|nr:HNH endonuclease signature motif containing protein [Aneurinibacillus sp. Ricciae_BoGa-3]WCK57630.1 HNH endonuclease signature motif containing protein [Aneurinibacillus sp. Ricciae_BoGa-3]